MLSVEAEFRNHREKSRAQAMIGEDEKLALTRPNVRES